ncbi:MAG: 2-C-methyl-D-erythritol 4-phosphate cytidylyltransferase [Prevotellaceae bacterium]|jgi:2-C-methyl-D-erythritol 4-phosphate cytidylyltransferase|nr:2-C-methyl-D-erythritol 4-phosphate cytidylyltransferase [Prevotellaceae bacterium]
MKNIAVILSGGVGERMNSSCPKQYMDVGGQPVIAYTLQKFTKRKDISNFVIVADKKWRDFILSTLSKDREVVFANPGTTRQHSIYNALKVLKQQKTNENDIVIIHDAVRPCVSDNIITQCIEGCENFDGVLPVIPIKDTVYQSKDGRTISNLLNRNELFAGQSPESFRFEKYLEIHEKMSDEEISKINGSSEIAFKNGLNILLTEGEECNFKITTIEDFNRFKNNNI